MILHGIEYQRPTSLNMRIMADHVTYSFLAFMKSIFHFCLGCYCGGYSQNGRSNLSSLLFVWSYLIKYAHNSIISDFSIFGFHNVIFQVRAFKFRTFWDLNRLLNICSVFYRIPIWLFLMIFWLLEIYVIITVRWVVILALVVLSGIRGYLL